MRRRGDDEKGAAAVELAVSITLLLVIAIGAVEWGMALKDWLSVTGSTRLAARVGAAAGDEADADCRILEAAAGSLQNVSNDQVVQVWVYKTDSGGSVLGPKQRFRPARPTDDPATLRCGTWFPLEQTWTEPSRDNDGSTRDWLGVRVVFDHDWITNFLWWNGSVCSRGTLVGVDCWQANTIMRVEPDPTP